MKKQDKLPELARLLRFQQSLLHLAVHCTQPKPARKRPAAASTRALEELARKLETQAS
ncbi:MAG: hypothetical protein WHT08_11940 [Bryobacteraceae bacterium]|jgi:hypothetical protein